MKFDFVFDVQSAFRKLLHAFSYPGEIVSLEEEASHIDQTMNCFDATQILMYMLLDTETNFYTLANDAGMTQQRFSQLTYSPISDVEHAHFIFVLQSRLQEFADVLKEANCGSLLDPQNGATLIVECEELTARKGYTLKGPGIKEETTIDIKGVEEDWLDIRNTCCGEYPLGVDIIFIDRQHQCAVVPRTTRITR